MNLSNVSIVIVVMIIAAIALYIAYVRYFYLKTTVSEAIKDKIFLKISVPVKNDKKALAAEQMFQSLHGILRHEEKSIEHYSFEIFAASQGIYFVVAVSRRYKTFVENQIYAQYPEAQINEVTDYAVLSQGYNLAFSELRLSKEFFYPIKTFTSFEVDPLASITGSVANLQTGYEAWIQVISRPVDNKWQEKGKKFVEAAQVSKTPTGTEAKKVSDSILENLKEIEKKSSKVGFQFIVRVIVKGLDPIMTQRYLEDIEASFKQFQTAQQNSIIKIKKKDKNIFVKTQEKIKSLIQGKRPVEKLSIPQKYLLRFLDERETNILNTEELASIYHLPNESVKTPNIAWAKSKKLEFPLNLPIMEPKTDGTNVRAFALTDYRNIHLPFGIKKEDRRRHMYLLGKTGTGKTTFLKNMIVGDIMDGNGIAVLDPHGDLVDELLDLIPEHRMKDVVYLDPSDIEYPIGLNVLDIHPDETKDLLADGIVNVFKKFFEDSWGPRLQYILTNTLITLLECQNVSLLAVQRILTDANYRKFLLKQVKDPFLLKFWDEEFAAMSANPRMLAEALAPIQNKVGRFLNSTMVRNMLGQIKSSISLQDIMNDQKILLVNLSQGKIGEENSSLLGAMIVTRLYSNAMQRAKIAKDQRKDFYLYVDEFQNFATDSFIKILSEARKYGLDLIVTHQYIDQIDEGIQDAIFGNVGTLMNYVVGQKDSLRLEQEYTPHLTSEDLINLDRYRLAMKMTIDGAQTPPFTAIALKPNYYEYGLKEQIKALSRETYAKPRLEVEMKLNKWANQSYDKKGNLVQKQEGQPQNQDKSEDHKSNGQKSHGGYGSDSHDNPQTSSSEK